MRRPPSVPVEKKTRIVLSVLAGELMVAEAARREEVSEQSIGRWKAEFLQAGETALVTGRNGPTSREERLEAEVVELTQALGEAAVEIRVWKRSAEGRWGPSRTLRWGTCLHGVLGGIRREAGVSTARWCRIFDIVSAGEGYPRCPGVLRRVYVYSGGTFVALG